MAISKTVTFRGISIPNAYIRVVRFDGNKSKLAALIGYFGSATSEIFDSMNVDVPYDVTGANPLAQIYDYIKTLPDFAGAVDC